jgi:hypothetical protein
MVSLLWRYGETSLFRQSLPRDYAMSRPHISIAVARSGGQGRRFFSAAEGLSLPGR